MEKIIQYLTNEEKTNIITENSTLNFIGERNIFENGDYINKNNYLIFSDTKPVEMQLKDLNNTTNMILLKQEGII